MGCRSECGCILCLYYRWARYKKWEWVGDLFESGQKLRLTYSIAMVSEIKWRFWWSDQRVKIFESGECAAGFMGLWGYSGGAKEGVGVGVEGWNWNLWLLKLNGDGIFYKVGFNFLRGFFIQVTFWDQAWFFQGQQTFHFFDRGILFETKFDHF